jgi:hypothetical protein
VNGIFQVIPLLSNILQKIAAFFLDKTKEPAKRFSGEQLFDEIKFKTNSRTDLHVSIDSWGPSTREIQRMNRRTILCTISCTRWLAI